MCVRVHLRNKMDGKPLLHFAAFSHGEFGDVDSNPAHQVVLGQIVVLGSGV
jgi:hypothetical protein